MASLIVANAAASDVSASTSPSGSIDVEGARRGSQRSKVTLRKGSFTVCGLSTGEALTCADASEGRPSGGLF
jgi:hypothetical protein